MTAPAPETARVLLVDDDRAVREALGQTLELAGLVPLLAGSFVEAKHHIAPAFGGVIVTDIRMPGRDGFYLLDHARSVDPELPVILLTGEGDVPMAVRAIEKGAVSFLEKPCAPADFVAAVRMALDRRRATLGARRHKRQSEAGDAAARMLIGQSPLAEDLRARVRAAARTSVEVLVTGEPGSGTPKIAEVIHLLSPAAAAPFVKRAAAGLTVPALGEALAAAEGGTLFLDEVGFLPQPTQFALLDRLETGTRTGRIVAGATRGLEAEVEAGRFGGDLYWRLDMLRLRVPSLRERKEDIPMMFRHFVSQACEQANLPEPAIAPDLLARLMAQDWPGNARSLMNAAMRLAVGLPLGDAPAEGAADPGRSDDGSAGTTGRLGLGEQMARVERSLLVEALRRNAGHATDTARELCLPRKTFYDKLARHGLRAEDYRGDPAD